MSRKDLNKEKLEYLENKLRNKWNNQDFIDGVMLDIDYEHELNAMIKYVEDNPNATPSDILTAQMDMIYGKGNWEDGQLIEIVDD